MVKEYENIKVFKYEHGNLFYYALGSFDGSGLIINTNDSNNNYYYLGGHLGCHTNILLGNDIEAPIDMELLKSKDVFLTIDNKLILVEKKRMIDLNKKIIYKLDAQELRDIVKLRYSDRTHITLKNG
jgi:hypothetical protein